MFIKFRFAVFGKRLYLLSFVWNKVFDLPLVLTKVKQKYIIEIKCYDSIIKV